MSKKEKPYSVEVIKRGKKPLGEIRRLPDGRAAFFAYKRMRDMGRGNQKTYSDAIRAKEATWGFDAELLLKLKKMDVGAIGVLVKQTGDTYLISAEAVSDPHTSRLVHRGWGSSRHVPVHLFAHTAGKVKV
jgi:hypothetical protein